MEKRTLVVVDSTFLAETLQPLVGDGVLVDSVFSARTGYRFDTIILLSVPDFQEGRPREIVQQAVDDMMCKLAPNGTLVRSGRLPSWLRVWP